MYEKIEKYIYKIGDDNYRIKIQRKDKETGLELKISENHKLPLEKVIKIRDQYIENFEEKIKFKKMDFNSTLRENIKVEPVEDNKVNKKEKNKIQRKKG